MADGPATDAIIGRPIRTDLRRPKNGPTPGVRLASLGRLIRSGHLDGHGVLRPEIRSFGKVCHPENRSYPQTYPI